MSPFKSTCTDSLADTWLPAEGQRHKRLRKFKNYMGNDCIICGARVRTGGANHHSALVRSPFGPPPDGHQLACAEYSPQTINSEAALIWCDQPAMPNLQIAQGGPSPSSCPFWDRTFHAVIRPLPALCAHFRENNCSQITAVNISLGGLWRSALESNWSQCDL